MANEWKAKLLERLRKANLSLDSDDDRVLKEVALFAEKCDVSEEISRLRSHFAQILSTLSLDGSVGRKIEFLLQEVSRELNTFCSKSTRTECTSIALDARCSTKRKSFSCRPRTQRHWQAPLVAQLPSFGQLGPGVKRSGRKTQRVLLLRRNPELQQSSPNSGRRGRRGRRL